VSLPMDVGLDIPAAEVIADEDRNLAEELSMHKSN